MHEYLPYFVSEYERILTSALEHLTLTGIAVVLGILVAVPLGIVLSKHPKPAAAVFAVINTIQTIPSLALLGMMIPLFGLGNVPAVIALFLYSLLPILRNTVAGITGVNRALVEAATGLGMTRLQVLVRVELPLAMSAIMAGIRTSTVIIFGWATMAAYIGGDGLGTLIVAGMAMGRVSMILAGALPAVCLALIIDYLLGKVERRFSLPE